MGVVGLGAGTINWLLRDRDSIIYYEINPMDEELARKYFTYLKRPATRVVIGDGRTLLDQEPGLDLDVLVVDAFNGDAIPTHLLTREAGMIYRRQLKKDGALAIHITNAHVALLPVVKGLARSMGMTVESYETETSAWAILKPGPEKIDGRIIEWTDDRSSILAVLKPYRPSPESR
jgi:spermidine synthase